VRLTITKGPDRLDLAAALFSTRGRPRHVSFLAVGFSEEIVAYLDGVYRVAQQEHLFQLHGRLNIGNEFRPFVFVYDVAALSGIIDC
jgi:hypothetical protein